MDPVAVDMPTGRTAVQIDTTDQTFCAVMDDESVYCWGFNGNYNLGCNSQNSYETAPCEVSESASSVQVGYDHTCAIVTDAPDIHSMVKCWG